jgi:REP element-mobilizing transposase RayT
MAGTYNRLVYHLIFGTKNREPMITPRLQPEIYAYIGGILRGQEGSLLEIGGMPDHIHLVVRIKPDLSVSEIVRLVKANSSKWVNEASDPTGRFAWQRGYGAFTVSQSQEAVVCRYVRNQARHHHVKTFQEEFIEFLKRHEIAFDERYLWD